MAALGSKLAGIATGVAARKASKPLLDKVWRKYKHSDPPEHPASPDTPWPEAISWAVASGIAYGVARLVAMKGVASAKAKVTGKVPEGMEGPGPKRRSKG